MRIQVHIHSNIPLKKLFGPTVSVDTKCPTPSSIHINSIQDALHFMHSYVCVTGVMSTYSLFI